MAMVDGTSGNDILGGTLDDDVINGFEGDDIIYGDQGNDIITGGAGDDQLFGYIGNDTFILEANVDGIDAIDGGDGYDVIQVNGDNAVLTFSSLVGIEAIYAGANSTLQYGTTDDTINLIGTYFYGDITVKAGAGNDTIYGGINVAIYGEDGNDTLLVSGLDVFDGGTGSDTVSFETLLVSSPAGIYATLLGGYGYYLTGAGYERYVTFTNVENLTGSMGDDVLEGDDNANIIYGGRGGRDIIDAGGGNDTIVVDRFNVSYQTPDPWEYVTIDGGSGIDTVVFSDDFTDGSVGIVRFDMVSNVEIFDASSYDPVGNSFSGSSLVGTSGDDVMDASGLTLINVGLAGGNGNDIIYGTNGNDVINGGSGIDSLYGGTGNDTFHTVPMSDVSYDQTIDDSVDYFDGGDGYDTIHIDTGNGLYVSTGSLNSIERISGGLYAYMRGTEGNDIIDVSNIFVDNDTTAGFYYPEGGVNIFVGDFSCISIQGGGGADTIIGNGQNNTFFSGVGVQTIYAASGDDWIGTNGYYSYIDVNGNIAYDGDQNHVNNIDGGEGTDYFVFNTVGCTHRFGTFLSIEHVISTGPWATSYFVGVDSGVTWDFTNTTFHGPIDISGGGGNDTIIGSAGDDLFSGSAGADTLNGGAGIDTLTYASSSAGVTVNLLTNAASGGDAAGDIISNFENLTGSAFNDTLTGSNGANTLLGGNGNDTLEGRGGADTLDGGSGTDTLSYANSAAGVTVNLLTNTASGGDAAGDIISNFENLTGSSANDTLTGNAGANTILGGAGNDTIDGGAGNDTITGGAGADTLNGGSGTDTLSYATSAAGVTVNLLTNTASGGDAAGDIISNFENITGSSANDTLTGNAGNNTLSGGTGNDTINGGAGNDTILGGTGADILTGGAGVDIFDLNLISESGLGTLADLISDFTQGQDKIDLNTIDASTLIGGNQNFSFLGTGAFSNVAGQLRYTTGSGDGLTHIFGDVNGDGVADFEIKMTGTYTMAATDFIL